MVRSVTQEHRRKDVVASAAAARIVQEAVKPDCSAADLAELATADPGFAMRLLALVNSAAYGLPSKVTDVRRAAGLLGVRGLRNLALSLIVGDMAPMNEGGRLLLANSIRRAGAARAIAAALGERQPDELFTVGLFLESGLLGVAADDPETAAALAGCPASHRVVRERAGGLQPHPERGAALAERMDLPPETIEAIRRHHDDTLPEGRVAGVAWVAERMAAVFEGGAPQQARDAAIAAAAELGLDEAAASRILDEIPAMVRDGASAFDRELGEQIDLDALVADANASLVEMNLQYEEIIRTLEAVIAEKEALAHELEEANAQLSMLASTDALTGLPNKRALTQALARDLARTDRQAETLSLVVVDVDHFKKFNDTWGHSTGDEVLRVVGQVLKTGVRTGDMAARYGGEEFVFILPNTDGDGAHVVADRVRRKLAGTAVAGPKGPLFVTASFGIATVSGPGCKDAAQSLFEAADKALYAAKEAGRNCVQRAAA
ncbi:MAG: diguanylate cyclase [Myxococcota bacterium]|nr:diguanylate cyclase [Myxococcota bacterium]